MEKMGWTYEQYLDQPNWVIDLLIEKGVLESKLQEKWRQAT